jgi:hypothetical protein
MVVVGSCVRSYVRASAVANISTTAIGILMKLGIWVPGTIFLIALKALARKLSLFYPVLVFVSVLEWLGLVCFFFMHASEIFVFRIFSLALSL